MASQDHFSKFLQRNKEWASSTAEHKPDLFPTLASGQKPQILWLGCADSRLPETTILGLQPGDVFVHRNIANIIPATDLNSQSVIQFAVAVLKVQHIVVCGHTSCGGVNAALGNAKLGLIDAWLMPLRKLRAQHTKEWAHLGEKERALQLVEANVRQGVQTLKENPEVIEGVKDRGVLVHGLIYDVATGELKQLEVEEEEEKAGIRVDAFRLS